MLRSHLSAAVLGFVTILTFWTATVLSELSGSQTLVVAVKQAIPWGLLILIPALITTGATGFAMARTDSTPTIRAKKRRMPFIAANGLLILTPCALYLDALASRGDLGTTFVTVQAIELVAGALNITLMARNARDGLRLSGRLRRPARL